MPHAVTLYHLEAYLNNSNDKRLNTEIVESSFIPLRVQKTVQSIYQVDKLLQVAKNLGDSVDQVQLVSHVLDLLKSDLVRAQSLLALLVS